MLNGSLFPILFYRRQTYTTMKLIKMRASALSSLIALIFASLCFMPAQAQSIRILYEDGADSIGTYCMGAIQLALEHIDHNYTIEPVTGDRSPARVIEDVRSGDLDLLWGSADRQIESTLLPVRIPLYKGLLGHRIFLIHEDNQAKFNNIRTLADIKRAGISFGQGATWADTLVLEHNGLDVVRVNKYPSLFYMVDGGRYDAFPRGLQEPWGEVESWSELDLAVEQQLMLVYRMPFYLFVSPENPQLAADLEEGFNRAIANGSFDEYFLNDPTVQDAIGKANIQNRIAIELDNPTLPPLTPVDRPELWLDPKQL